VENAVDKIVTPVDSPANQERFSVCPKNRHSVNRLIFQIIFPSVR
jgi:hypothetical protein